MTNLETLILFAGFFHFGILIAGILAPKVLDWKNSLKQLPQLSQHVIWVHGAFILLVIIGFGTLSVLYRTDLASGAPLARAVTGFIALFWGSRFILQLVMFRPGHFLSNPLLKIGYHGLTIMFAYFAIVFGYAALGA